MVLVYFIFNYYVGILLADIKETLRYFFENEKVIYYIGIAYIRKRGVFNFLELLLR